VPLPTVPLASILPLVSPHLDEISDYLVIQMLRLAAIEFCERTNIWREMLTVTLDSQDEPVITPAHAALHEIESATFDSALSSHTPLQPIRFMATTPQERAVDPTGQPRYITQTSANTISIVPYAPGTITLAAILKPIAGPAFGVDSSEPDPVVLQDRQNVIPAFLFQQFAHTIANGALYRLKTMSNRPWSDQPGAATFFSLFNQSCDTSFNAAIRGQHKARRRAAYSFY